MFGSQIYMERRRKLKQLVKSGLVLLAANDESPMNYAANTYRYRQDSSFLYYFGLDDPGIAGIIDVDNDLDIIFADELEIEDIIWMGNPLTFREKAGQSGISRVNKQSDLSGFISDALKQGRRIHYLKPYRDEQAIKLAALLTIDRKSVAENISEELVRAIVSQRSLKGAEEIMEIEKAHDITRLMHVTAMKMAGPGKMELEIAGTIEGIALSGGSGVSFPVILSVHGEILHNHSHANRMESGDLLVNDSGAESIMHYAADITRTFPVNGKFTTKQREIYEIVLKSQEAAIDASGPGVKYRDVHLLTAKIIAEGLKDLGLMKGDIDEAVEQGAHALFFPHGLGHMMGLDVHDMENMGEQYVGYDETVQRSDQFGLAYLRLAKALQPGYVVTVEPGIYFIPALINKWRTEKLYLDFINYQNVENYLGFGGIRIEDDILITKQGCRALGQPIPKTIIDVEKTCQEI